MHSNLSHGEFGPCYTRTLLSMPCILALPKKDNTSKSHPIEGNNGYEQEGFNCGMSSSQELFGALHISDAVAATGPEALASLAALVKHLRRLKLTPELATEEHTVRHLPPNSMSLPLSSHQKLRNRPMVFSALSNMLTL